MSPELAEDDSFNPMELRESHDSYSVRNRDEEDTYQRNLESKAKAQKAFGNDLTKFKNGVMIKSQIDKTDKKRKTNKKEVISQKRE
jgi:hypothetical protein